MLQTIPNETTPEFGRLLQECQKYFHLRNHADDLTERDGRSRAALAAVSDSKLQAVELLQLCYELASSVGQPAEVGR